MFELNHAEHRKGFCRVLATMFLTMSGFTEGVDSLRNMIVETMLSNDSLDNRHRVTLFHELVKELGISPGRFMKERFAVQYTLAIFTFIGTPDKQGLDLFSYDPSASLVYLRSIPALGFHQLLSEPHGLWQLTWNSSQPYHRIIVSEKPVELIEADPHLKKAFEELSEYLVDDSIQNIRGERRRAGN